MTRTKSNHHTRTVEQWKRESRKQQQQQTKHMSQIQSRAHATWHIDTFITAMNAHIQQVRNVRQGGIQVGSTHNVWVRHRPYAEVNFTPIFSAHKYCAFCYSFCVLEQPSSRCADKSSHSSSSAAATALGPCSANSFSRQRCTLQD